MACADSNILHCHRPHFSDKDTNDCKGEGTQHNHHRPDEPTFAGLVAFPYPPCHDARGESIEQKEGEVDGYVDQCAVASEMPGNFGRRYVVRLADFLEH